MAKHKTKKIMPHAHRNDGVDAISATTSEPDYEVTCSFRDAAHETLSHRGPEHPISSFLDYGRDDRYDDLLF